MNNTSKIKLPSGDPISKSIFLSSNIVNPKRDWSILIILFFVLIVASIGFDYYMYQQIVSGDMYITVKKEDIVIENLKSTDLQNILNNFESKNIKITNLKLDNLVDPSI